MTCLKQKKSPLLLNPQILLYFLTIQSIKILSAILAFEACISSISKIVKNILKYILTILNLLVKKQSKLTLWWEMKLISRSLKFKWTQIIMASLERNNWWWRLNKRKIVSNKRKRKTMSGKCKLLILIRISNFQKQILTLTLISIKSLPNKLNMAYLF